MLLLLLLLKSFLNTGTECLALLSMGTFCFLLHEEKTTLDCSLFLTRAHVLFSYYFQRLFLFFEQEFFGFFLF